LIYGTGGAAFAHEESTLVSTETVTAAPNVLGGPGSLCALGGITCIFPNFFHNTSGGTRMFGWALGGGIDWKHQLDAGSALVFGVEYLHYGFPEQTITLSDNAGGTSSFRAKENVDVVKGRISYLFSIH
jgi:hypothetical protein